MWVPVPSALGVYVAKQLAVDRLPERLHELETKVPPLSDANETVPVGVVVPDEVTVAVHFVLCVRGTEEGAHATAVVVVSPGTVTVSENWPLLRP